MSFPAKCRTCGHSFVLHNFIGGTSTVVMNGGTTNCPGCGGLADIQSGIYSMVDSVIMAFTAPGMTRENVEALRDIAQQVQSGNIASHVARDEIAKRSSSLAKVWNWVGENDKQLQVLLILIGLFLAHYHFVQMSADGQADQEVRQSAAQASQKNAQALEKIGAELQRMNIATPAPELPAEAIQQSQTTPPKQTTGLKRRGDKRRADALERKRMKKPSRRPGRGGRTGRW